MYGVVEKETIGSKGHNFAIKSKERRGFGLAEVLVVLAIISVLIGTLLPVAAKARRQAKALQCMSNQRQIAAGVNFFAIDHDEKYPESVATIGSGNRWGWQEPMMMTACYSRDPERVYRSMSAYLRSYIGDASIMFCPNAPRKYEYLQAAWDAGDNWDNPDAGAPQPKDPVYGTYCFYWNYIGYLGGRRGIFKGPWAPSGGRGQSKLLVSDYFGFGHSRNEDTYGTGNFDAYGSSEIFEGAGITEGTCVSSAFWSRLKSDGDISLDTLKIKLHAAYMDGHVERYYPSEVVPMKVSKSADGTDPYPTGAGIGPGDIYLPRNGLP